MTCMPSLHPERRHFLKQMLGAALLCSSSSLRPQWTVLFRHNALQQPGSITGWNNSCTLTLRGSRPESITLSLRRVLRSNLDRDVVARIYVGWPHNSLGQITGVRNQSADPPSARWIEQKLGPTLVWTASGCAQLCVQSVLLNYDVVILRGNDTIEVLHLAAPLIEQPCLTPAWSATPGAPAGAIDQPGCTIAALGDGFADMRGRRFQVQADDRVQIDFQQRALLYADDAFIGADEYGFSLAAHLGHPAYEILPNVSPLATAQAVAEESSSSEDT
jgi:hypothetical protein